jgi:hypothetical protein
MTLQDRIELLFKLGQYIENNDENWQQAKQTANAKNPWFIPDFINHASTNIASCFLQKDQLEKWLAGYAIALKQSHPKMVGLVMAGNIPMVGFHDMLSIFVSGHRQLIKLSSKDDVLIPHLVQKLVSWDDRVADLIQFADKLKGCEAYIATGSNNSGRYFEYYFGKFPNIIRKNRTSVAILTGEETSEALELLADDIQLYFGLGCRNVTKLYVPENYSFEPLLKALEKYDWMMEFHKYRHNYDYQLALLMMGNKFYMNNGSILLNKSDVLFTPVSQVNYQYYNEDLTSELMKNEEVQCIVGSKFVAFGQSQKPTLKDYADGADTMDFLAKL